MGMALVIEHSVKSRSASGMTAELRASSPRLPRNDVDSPVSSHVGILRVSNPDSSQLNELEGSRTEIAEDTVVRRNNCGNGSCYKRLNQGKLGQAIMCATCHDEVEHQALAEEPSKTEHLLTGDIPESPMKDSVCYSDMKREVKGLRKPVKGFYKRQNEVIRTFEEVYLSLDDDNDTALKEAAAERNTLRLAETMSKITFTCNLLLLVAKGVAVFLSGSLVIISSMLDSAMDLVSGILMWWSNRAIKNTSYNLYPKGRRKLEPVAIVMLAVIMSFVSIQLIHESILKIVVYATHRYAQELARIDQWTASFNLTASDDWLEAGPVNASDWSLMVGSVVRLKEQLGHCARGQAAAVFETPTVAICVATIVVKLVLFIVCRRVDNPSVQALAKDHFNDVISNSGTIALGLIGYKLWKYADPIGAIIISLWIIANWSSTARDQIRMLTGYTARPSYVQTLTWLALHHDARIKHINSVVAFHHGSRFHVELEIVLPGEMHMREARDVSESLRQKIERLPQVERAFVHMHYRRDDSACSVTSPQSASAPTSTTDKEILSSDELHSRRSESEISDDPHSTTVKRQAISEHMMASSEFQADESLENHVISRSRSSLRSSGIEFKETNFANPSKVEAL